MLTCPICEKPFGNVASHLRGCAPADSWSPEYAAWDRFKETIERALIDPSPENIAARILAKEAFVSACGE